MSLLLIKIWNREKFEIWKLKTSHDAWQTNNKTTITWTRWREIVNYMRGNDHVYAEIIKTTRKQKLQQHCNCFWIARVCFLTVRSPWLCLALWSNAKNKHNQNQLQCKISKQQTKQNKNRKKTKVVCKNDNFPEKINKKLLEKRRPPRHRQMQL